MRELRGFGNEFQTEAIAGALPIGQNSPQKAPLGLYAEQVSGSAFTMPRAHNKRSWLYRILPSVVGGRFENYQQYHNADFVALAESLKPEPYRWGPLMAPEKMHHFVDGLIPFAYNALGGNHICLIMYYTAQEKMESEYFYNTDGEMLILPQEGGLDAFTEFGKLSIDVGEFIVIPQGCKFQISPKEKVSKGYVLENSGEQLHLPDLGPIGANGLANPRDFIYPQAAYEDKQGEFKLYCKMKDRFFVSPIQHSPLNVVAWHGNYAPYKYNLKDFNTINTVSYDHPDPSIFTVLTSQTTRPGLANLDFVIFPPRWMVAENSFRPPWYHRNCMSEFMGLLYGEYDAKPGGFKPGGASLHNPFVPHGPDSESFEKASQAELKPERYEKTMAFMFESNRAFYLSPYAMKSSNLDQDYILCWQNLKKNFKPE